MNRSERRKRKKNPFRNLPQRIKKQRENMAVVIVTAAIATLAEDFGFTPDQLQKFEERMRERSAEFAKPKGGD